MFILSEVLFSPCLVDGVSSTVSLECDIGFYSFWLISEEYSDYGKNTLCLKPQVFEQDTKAIVFDYLPRNCY